VREESRNMEKLTKLEVSSCMEAVEICMDIMQTKLDRGDYVQPDLVKEEIENDKVLIEKLKAIWKEMPVENKEVK
jgi:hypothetical protein